MYERQELDFRVPLDSAQAANFPWPFAAGTGGLFPGKDEAEPSGWRDTQHH